MPRVFVAHQPRPAGANSRTNFDITPALNYGEVVFVFESSFSPSSDPDGALDIATEKMKDMTSEDYVLWAGGDPLASIIVGAVAFDMTDGEFNYLRWDRERGDGGVATGRGFYTPIPINF